MSPATNATERDWDRRHALWLALTVLLAHGLLLLNDGVYWDGFLIASGRAEPETLWRMFVDAGAVIGYPIHHGLLSLPCFPLGHKVTSLLSALVIAFATRRLAFQTGFLTSTESTLAGGIAGTWPALLVDVELVMVPYPVCFAAFLVGWAAFTHAPQPSVKARAFALICLIPSFSIRSLLVLHIGACALLLIARAMDATESEGSFLRRLLRQGLRHADLLLVPFLYWGANELLFPRRAEYADYNRIKLVPAAMLRALVSSILTALARWPLSSLKSLARDPVALVVAVVVAAAGYRAFRASSQVPLTRSRTAGWVVAVGIWLLVCGAIPYAAVGLSPQVHGWGRRHGLLTGLGTAIIVLGMVALVRGRVSQRVGAYVWMLPVVYVAASAGALVDGFLGWQARAAKDKSIVLHLREADAAREASVLWIDDRYPRGEETDYRFYEWSSMGELAWGDERHVGFPLGTAPEVVRDKAKWLTHAYNASGVDLEGCAALVSLSAAGPPESDWRLGLRYTAARVRGGGAAPAAWLKGLLSFRAEALPLSDGKNCRRQPAALSP